MIADTSMCACVRVYSKYSSTAKSASTRVFFVPWSRGACTRGLGMTRSGIWCEETETEFGQGHGSGDWDWMDWTHRVNALIATPLQKANSGVYKYPAARSRKWASNTINLYTSRLKSMGYV